jgi:hypothetical protein
MIEMRDVMGNVHVMNVCVQVEVQLHTLLISALNEADWSDLRPGYFTPTDSPPPFPPPALPTEKKTWLAPEENWTFWK